MACHPNLNVKIVGFMPGISTPGGQSHQAIDDIALMRVLPNMKVLDLADATEISQAVNVAAQERGPVYLRLKRGRDSEDIRRRPPPELGKANLVRDGDEVVLVHLA